LPRQKSQVAKAHQQGLKRHDEVNPVNKKQAKEREMDASHLKGNHAMDVHPMISSILFWFIFMEEIRLSKINTTMFDYIIITTNKILLIHTEIYLEGYAMTNARPNSSQR